jgi:hypothetical protein
MDARTELPRYLTEAEVASMTGLALQTLRNDRCSPSRRLPYTKFGKAVRYNLEDVVNFLESHKVAANG